MHAALVAAVVVVAGVLAIVAGMTPEAPLESLRGTLRLVGALELAVMIVASAAIRRTLTGLPAGADRDVWWGTQGPKAIVLWALAEGTAMLGVVFWLLTRDVVLFGALVGAGLVALLLTAPGRLEQG
jgi:hypothetical protein